MTIKIIFFVNLNNDHQGRQHSSSSTDGLFLGLLTQQKLLLFHLRNTQYSLYVLNEMIKLSRGRFVSSFRVPSPFFSEYPSCKVSSHFATIVFIVCYEEEILWLHNINIVAGEEKSEGGK